MNAETIIEYHRWADRGYVTALTCRNHEYHRLIPTQDQDGIVVKCPRGDYSRIMGKIEYDGIQKKIEMSKWLWELNNV